MLKVGSDFSGVGAFNQALIRLGKPYKEVFACDMDKYARQTFIENYGEPEYYPTNVYDRKIPKESLDIYMTSPPCQAFSLAGNRLGKDDKRGILFFNSYEFIQVNKPRFFIFENVKGLLSDDNGKTFSEWVNMLGGKSVNGVPVLFPYEESVPYHLYWKVLNAKEHGIPQNRERVFLIGIRDDSDNKFQFPKEEHLTKRLKDVLEENVDNKYFLSHKMINYISKDRNGNDNLIVNRDVANTVTCEIKKMQRSVQDNYINEDLIIFECKHDLRNCINTSLKHRLKDLCNFCDNGEEFVNIEDMEIMLKNTNSVIQINQSKESGGKQPYQQNRIYDSNGICPALNAGQVTWGGNLVLYNIKRLNQTLQKHKLPNKEVIIDSYNQTIHDESICISTRVNASSCTHLWDKKNIRRLTPRECFRLMDFPESFTWLVSDSQAYKQAGNSIVVNVLYKILKNLPL